MEEFKKLPEQENSKFKKRKCRYCGSEVEIKTGTDNWKSLFRKPSLDEWITLFIIIMVILSSYAYKHDIKQITEFYTNESYCTSKLIFIEGEIKVEIPNSPLLLNPSNLYLDEK